MTRWQRCTYERREEQVVVVGHRGMIEERGFLSMSRILEKNVLGESVFILSACRLR